VKILLVNDDGPENELTIELADELRRRGNEVLVIVPEKQRSAVGMARTYHKPLRIRRRGDLYVINGTPSDAVFIGLRMFMNDADLVISGVNIGENVGLEAVIGGGTLGAAIQASVLGYRALAFSVEAEDKEKFTGGRLHKWARSLEVIPRIVEALTSWPLGVDLININIPTSWSQIAITRRVARLVYNERVIVGEDPRGVPIYWRWGERMESLEPCSDAYLFYKERALVVTPISLVCRRELDLRGLSNALSRIAPVKVVCE